MAGWNKRGVIDSLVAKAGYKGKINDRFRENINLTRYQTSKSVVSYSKYAAAASRDNTSSSSRRRHHHYHLSAVEKDRLESSRWARRREIVGLSGYVVNGLQC